MMKTASVIGAIAVLVLGATGPVFAADMALKAPIMPPPPVYVWTGCYIGGNLGGAWMNKDFHFGTENEGSMNPGGFAGGGQVGCDYQFASNWLIGVQGMFDGTTISATDIDPTGDGDRYPTTLQWFATATARVGFLATPALLLYAKGGAAWVAEKIDYNDGGPLRDSSGSFTRSGWDVGGGVEWMFAPGWSAFVEYDHMDFGTKDVFLTRVSGSGGFTETIKQSVDKVLVGIDYRFNLGKVQ
jgi:outer membrane immunogenic protein